MKRCTLLMITALAGLLACGGGGNGEESVAMDTATMTPPSPQPVMDDTLPPPEAAESAPTEPQRTQPPSTTLRRPPRSTQLQTRQPVQGADLPFATSDTGTVAPGMNEAQVTALWGAPAGRRQDGAFIYLFFRNGCEYTCGMKDVVLLHNDSVVDALLRFPGHRYAGISSSPPGSVPAFTPPDTTQRGSPNGD